MPLQKFKKREFPTPNARQLLEPGPVVLVSSTHRGERDIMTIGWHMVVMDDPSIVGCFIWDKNYSYELIRRSKECVINVPTVDLLDVIIGIGNTHGPKPDKFDAFGLTAKHAQRVAAPLIEECYANFECRLIDTALLKRYSIFIFRIVTMLSATTPKFPTTVHYRGDGIFMVSGRNVDRSKQFKTKNL